VLVHRRLCAVSAPARDTSLLQIGTRLIGINASLYKAPQHCTVASPLFSQHGGLAVILEPYASRNNYEPPGLKHYYNGCRAVFVHIICQMHMSKTYKPAAGTRFLLRR
jgi:hypothetical protein